MSTFSLKRFFFGNPRKTSEMEHERMPVFKALPILSSDAISSVAYGTEEILTTLTQSPEIAGTTGLALAGLMFYSLPISLAIVALLAILVLSYRQVIFGFPQGGGAYNVTKENLGEVFANITGVSLMIDYTLTVAVSVSAGVMALVSAFPAIANFQFGFSGQVWVALVLVLFMTIMNLRGTGESGNIFAIPTYAFLIGLLAVVGKVLYDWATGASVIHSITLPSQHDSNMMTTFLVLKMFSSGCSAVTGVEAISDATPHFKTPSVKNASKTLVLLGIILAFSFTGTSLGALLYGIVPQSDKSVLSMITATAYGHGFIFYFVQFATAAILTFAANTAFNALPILASIMANDRNFPRWFRHRGDRLAFNNGIYMLAIFATILLIVFKADTSALIPLYAIGVFLSFTLAQWGLVKKWLREKPHGMIWKIFINGTGALITFVVLGIFTWTKFMQGAWIVCVLIPILLLGIYAMKRHYNDLGDQLRMELDEPLPAKESLVIVPIAGIHQAVKESIAAAKSFSPSNKIVAFFIGENKEEIARMVKRWETWDENVKHGVRLVCYESRFREVVEPVVEFADRIDHRTHHTNFVMVLLPEFVTKKRWHRLLHNKTASQIRKRLIEEEKTEVIVATLPFYLKK